MELKFKISEDIHCDTWEQVEQLASIAEQQGIVAEFDEQFKFKKEDYDEHGKTCFGINIDGRYSLYFHTAHAIPFSQFLIANTKK